MKQERPSLAGAALTLSAAALLATPALAQDVQPAAPAAPAAQVAPPPVVRTLPATQAPSPATAAAGVKVGTSPTPVDPQAAAEAAANDAANRATRSVAHRAPQVAPRPAVTRATRIAPVAPARAAPAPAPAAPVAAAPAAAPPAPVAQAPAAVPAPEAAPVAQAPATPAAQATTTTTRSAPLWPWVLLVALLAVAAAGIAMWRRRAADRNDDVTTVEPTYVNDPAVIATPVAAATDPAYLEPAPLAAAPIMAAPLVSIPAANEGDPTVAAPALAEDATVVAADADDVASLTAGDAPVADRPWLEFAMRPVRAGTNVDEALVEIELTVGNAGSVVAQDVRITTFMLPAGSAGEMERLLLERPVDASVAPVTFDPGEGTRVDATLALSRAELIGGEAQHASFQPVVVADARYLLPDGSEGRTSASFLIGATPEDGDTLDAFDLSRAQMREDVEARLYRAPQHS